MSFQLRRALSATAILAVLFLAACGGGGSSDSSSTSAPAATTAPAAPTLIGTWVLDGPPPLPTEMQPFTFLKLTFNSDGTVATTYAPKAPEMFAMLGRADKAAALKPKQKTIKYETLDGGKLELTVFSDAQDWTYELRDGRLYLTPPMGVTTKVYRRAP